MSFISNERKHVSKVVKGKEIYRPKNSKGDFYIDLAPNKFLTFKTIKKAEAYINKFL